MGKDPRERLLEPSAQLLIRGTEAFAGQVRRSPVPHHWTPTTNKPLVPVVVTNARLFVTTFNPAAVSLESGSLEHHADAQIEPVDVVRFRKTFLSHPDHDLGEHTVFVVRAMAFGAFLDELAIAATGRGSPEPYPIGKER